jgi:hypothetical protein
MIIKIIIIIIIIIITIVIAMTPEEAMADAAKVQ